MDCDVSYYQGRCPQTLAEDVGTVKPFIHTKTRLDGSAPADKHPIYLELQVGAELRAQGKRVAPQLLRAMAKRKRPHAKDETRRPLPRLGFGLLPLRPMGARAGASHNYEKRHHVRHDAATMTSMRAKAEGSATVAQGDSQEEAPTCKE